MSPNLAPRRIDDYWRRRIGDEQRAAWTEHHDGTRACTQDCCSFPDGSPRWLDSDGSRLGPVPPPGHDYWLWVEYGRPQEPPWGSYLDATPLPKHPDRRGPLAYALDAIAARHI